MPIVRVGESGSYTGEHSISFRTKTINGSWGNWINTNTDWHLVPASRPVVNPPSVKVKTIDNPGGDGIIDLTESVTGFPLYEQRTGSWDFYVLNDWVKWQDRYEEILNELHGKNVQAILDDDKEYYYNGRITVNQWTSDKDHSKITLDYNFDPYKLSRMLSTEPGWLWDPFNFNTDVISYLRFKEIKVPNNKTLTIKISGAEVGRKPVTPEFVVSSGTCKKIRLYNKELNGKGYVEKTNVHSGSNHWMDMIITGFSASNENEIRISGTDCVMSIVYRAGKL